MVMIVVIEPGRAGELLCRNSSGGAIANATPAPTPAAAAAAAAAATAVQNNQNQMGLIFSPVYQPRHCGCIHVIHTFTQNKPYKKIYVQNLCLV